MEIKNLRTGKMVRFGGEHFKRLIRLQNSTGMKYFTKKDLALHLICRSLRVMPDNIAGI